MPVSPWKDVAVILPADGQVVWIRRLQVEVPYSVTYHSATNSFTMPNGLDLSWEFVSRWRA